MVYASSKEVNDCTCIDLDFSENDPQAHHDRMQNSLSRRVAFAFSHIVHHAHGDIHSSHVS